jgi:hypothetical protein
MATNPDFLKVVTKAVQMQWPRLDQPYRYNAVTKRSEACAATAPNAGYSVAFELQPADAKALFETARTHYEGCRARNPKLPAFAQVFGMKKDEEKKVFRFSAKKRAANNDGQMTKPPAVIGPDLKPIEDAAIWTGSTGKVRFLMFPATDPQTGNGGVSFLLDTVQVIEAVYGGDNYEDDFGPAEAPSAGSAAADFGDFAPAAPPPAAPRAAPATANEFGF